MAANNRQLRSMIGPSLGCWFVLALAVSVVTAEETNASGPVGAPAVRRPIGPADLPEQLPGRWQISLCVSDDNGHAWIRFQNAETGEIRSIGRFHLLVGGWFDRGRLRWNYLPTFRTGLYMDREQRREPELADGSEILRTAWVENPRVYIASGVRGHALVRNNCVTYARDAWRFYTGEYWELPAIHTPKSLRESVGHVHPEVLRVSKRGDAKTRWRFGR